MAAELTVYEMAHSPFCIPVTRVLEAFGVPFARVEVPNWDRSAVAEVAGGRYYQVPVLVHRGEAVFESGVDTQLESNPFLLGGDPVYADFLLYGVLGNYTFRGANPMPEGLPSLAAWRERLAGWRA